MPEFIKTSCPFCGKEAVGMFCDRDASNMTGVVWCIEGHVTVIDLDKGLTGQMVHQF